jgi:hypothetical protein
MDLKKVKGVLAAGALTGIILATVLGLGLRNIARAASTQNAPVVFQSAPAESGVTSNNNSDTRFFSEDNEHEGEHEGWEFNDD